MRFLKRVLADQLRPEEIAELYGAFDLVGDIAIIRAPTSLRPKLEIIARAIMENNKHVRTVLHQSSPVSGEFRTRQFDHILGEVKTETTYREHGCVFKVDLAKAYFSPRLSHERLRIARLVSPGESIVNMFAGVGTFSIVAARNSEAAKIYSIDLNPDAFRYMEENVRVNKVTGRVVPILGDASEVIASRIRGVADRVLMPLPEKAREFMGSAVLALKKEGWIHYYGHVHVETGEDPCLESFRELRPRLEEAGIDYRLDFSRVVREVGPRWSQVVLDLKITKASA
jgi:tRNA (guanine37-N1)-methyltransferase